MKNSFRFPGTAVSLLALLLPWGGTLRAADEALPELLPPHSKVVIGLRLQALVAALTANGFTSEMHQGVASVAGKIAIPGFDPLRDIDEVIVATESDAQNAPALLVLTGHFPALPEGTPAQMYKGAAVMDVPGSQGQVLALLDSATALGGPRAMVVAALDRRGTGAHLAPALVARLAPLRARYEVWGAGERIVQSGAAPAPAAAKLPANLQFPSIDRFAFGMSLSHGLDCTAEFHAADSKDAAQLRQWLQLLQGMMQSGQKGKSAAQFAVEMNGGNIRLSVSIPQDEWKKVLAQQRAAFEHGFAAGMSIKPAQPPVPTEQKIVTDASGNTVSVTLPGKK